MPRTAARAEQRAPQRKTPRSAINRYDVDEHMIPKGMSYEWKRVRVHGAEDAEHQINCEQTGWTPVPAERHPELAGKAAKQGATIERGGLMLMERPQELTDEAKELDNFAARDQVATQFARLKLEGKQAGATKVTKINKVVKESFLPEE